MPDSRIEVSVADLAKLLTIWLTVIGQRRPALIRDLWTRRGEQRDEAKRGHARQELARYLAEQIRMSGHEVTRRATAGDEVRARAAEAGTGPGSDRRR